MTKEEEREKILQALDSMTEKELRTYIKENIYFN